MQVYVIRLKLAAVCLLVAVCKQTWIYAPGDTTPRTLDTTSTTNTYLIQSDQNACSCNLNYKVCDQFCTCDTDCPQEERDSWNADSGRRKVATALSISNYYCSRSFLDKPSVVANSHVVSIDLT